MLLSLQKNVNKSVDSLQKSLEIGEAMAIAAA